MVSVILNGKSYQCATCKEELTIGQYQRILKEWHSSDPDILKRDNLNLFCILTKTDFKQLVITPENEQAIFECISWVLTEPFNYSKDLPKALQIGDQTLLIPNRIGGLSIGQNILLKQILDSCQYLEEGISMAVAIYLQPEYDTQERISALNDHNPRKFDYAKAKELEQVVSNMTATVVYPIGFFLLSRVLTGGQKSQGIWPRIQKILNLSRSKTLLS